MNKTTIVASFAVVAGLLAETARSDQLLVIDSPFLGTASRVISCTEDQHQLSLEAALLAMAPEGWNIGAICSGEASVLSYGPPDAPGWSGGTEWTIKAPAECSDQWGWELNAEALQFGPIRRLVFHTDDHVFRLQHDICEPRPFGSISGTMGGQWSQCAVADWGTYWTEPLLGDNLIANGDFELGNASFFTEYIYSPGDLTNEGWYDVLPDPIAAHPGAASYGDHTTGTGMMMAANGSPTPNVIVWQQTVSVEPTLTYNFCMWVSTWDASSPVPADLHVVLSGEEVLELDVLAPQIPGVWEQTCVTWQSGSDLLLQITITDNNLSKGSNDFALDDISLIRCLDIDGDGVVAIGDFLLVLAQWGPCPPNCIADLDGDGTVGILDFLLLLANWGPCP